MKIDSNFIPVLKIRKGKAVLYFICQKKILVRFSYVQLLKVDVGFLVQNYEKHKRSISL